MGSKGLGNARKMNSVDDFTMSCCAMNIGVSGVKEVMKGGKRPASGFATLYRPALDIGIVF